jgi:hypothetical protein
VAVLDVLVAAGVDVDDVFDVELELELPQPATSRAAVDTSSTTSRFCTGSSLPLSRESHATPTCMKDG